MTYRVRLCALINFLDTARGREPVIVLINGMQKVRSRRCDVTHAEGTPGSLLSLRPFEPWASVCFVYLEDYLYKRLRFRLCLHIPSELTLTVSFTARLWRASDDLCPEVCKLVIILPAKCYRPVRLRKLKTFRECWSISIIKVHLLSEVIRILLRVDNMPGLHAYCRFPSRKQPSILNGI